MSPFVVDVINEDGRVVVRQTVAGPWPVVLEGITLAQCHILFPQPILLWPGECLKLRVSCYTPEEKSGGKSEG